MDDEVDNTIEPTPKKLKTTSQKNPVDSQHNITSRAGDSGKKVGVGEDYVDDQKQQLRPASPSSYNTPAPLSDQEDEWNDRNEDIDQANTSNPDKRRPKYGGRQGTPESRTCPHCNKVISTKRGLKAHIDKFVCRKEQSDDNNNMVSDGKRKRERTKKGSNVVSPSKRFRGSVEDRTCPQCNREFTSELGLSYHVKHKVCIPTSGKKEAGTGLETLEPGAKFVTHFGVVEVIRDDRATPQGRLPSTIKNQAKKYQAMKTRVEAQNIRVIDCIASHLRGRRNRINSLYENKKLTKRSVFNAYFEGDPRIHRDKKLMVTPRPIPPDPNLPPQLCPDRIVECRLIQDKRQRFLSTDLERPVDVMMEDVSSRSPTHLFLQRKLLKEPYVEDLATYICAECGRRFISLTGMRYHMGANVCIQKQTTEAETRKKRQKRIELSASDPTANKWKILEPIQKTSLGQPDRRDRRGRKRSKATAMYPEVLISLGFKVVKDDMVFTEDIKLPPIVPSDEAPRDDSMSHDVDTDEEGPKGPGALLASLKKQLKHHQREYQRSAADQKHGSMYSAVFKSLGYKKPRLTIKPNEQRVSKRKRKSTKPPPPPKPLPPIIDTRALAHEVDAGRYPSIKRNDDEAHSDICMICRDGGDLICCNFCTNAEHLKCIRTRFTVKDPEPEDDFMCHKCIQCILHRRNRAEKRRLMKQQREDQRKQEEALEESRLNPGIQKGMEYPYLAARGQEVSELVELLKDAQTRLEQALMTSKMNNIRRKAMGCFYTKK